MNRGDTFVVLNPSSPETLWVVATRATIDGDVVVFPIRRVRPHYDNTCVIRLGEHRYVDRSDHFIDYEMGRVLSRPVQRTMSDLGAYQPNAPASGELLERIQQGALDSDFAPQKLQRMVREDRA